MKTFCLLVLITGWALAAEEPVAKSIALDGAIASALAHNPQLGAAKARIEAASGRALQSRAWPNPSLELSAEDLPVAAGGFSQAKNLAGVSQTVPFPGKKPLDARIGRQELEAADWEYRSREIELIRDVKSAFWSALAADRKLSVVTQLTGLARQTATAVRKRVEAGAVGDQEQLRAEIELERVQVEMTGLRREELEARERLRCLMGQPALLLGSLVGELNEQAQPTDLENARQAMLANHPNLRAILANRQRADLELRRAKLDPWPDVTFGVAGGRDEGLNETVMQFRVSVPLPLLDRSEGRKREAKANAEIARYNLVAAEQQLLKELGEIEARLQAAGSQVQAYRVRILPKAEAALQLVRRGFEAGKFGLLDLLDTQRTSAESRLAYYDKLLELNKAQAELESLLLQEQKSSVAAPVSKSR